MMTFRNHRLRDFAVPMSTNWLLNDLAEAKGKQELYTRQSPQVLKALREMALVQSVESSNRIEGGIFGDFSGWVGAEREKAFRVKAVGTA
jgi:hypothetical protein